MTNSHSGSNCEFCGREYPDEILKVCPSDDCPSNSKCDTCGAKLAPGNKPGNHVRGDKDEQCTKCYSGTVAPGLK